MNRICYCPLLHDSLKHDLQLSLLNVCVTTGVVQGEGRNGVTKSRKMANEQQ